MNDTNSPNILSKLMPYADGELDAAERAAVEQALADAPELQAELSELAAISSAARSSFVETTPDVDLSGVFDGVMARLDAETAAESAGAAAQIDGVRIQREAEEPSFFDSVLNWFKGAFTFEQPLASALVGAALIGLVALWMGSGPGDAVTAPEDKIVGIEGVKEPIEGVKKPRRGRVGEQTVGRNAASVVNYEVAEGEMRIEIDDEDPDAPIVLWHDTTGEKGL